MGTMKIAESALLAAQAGIATTGHNIANASTEGYNRQVVVQSAVVGSGSGIGFIGQGTEIVSVTRVYNQFLSNQVNVGIASKGELNTYYSQIQQVDNMLADPTVGLTPALQSFFSGVQDLSTDPSSSVTRQSLLSSAETLVSRFKSLDARLNEMYDSVNAQITSGVKQVNTYAEQIASLNDAIEKASTGGIGEPNDLLDQRDQLIAKLNEEVKLTVVKQGESYNVYVGNGQPLVVGAQTNEMVTQKSPTDPTRIEVGFNNNGVIVNLTDDALAGGNLAGLASFRSETLDEAKNSLGRVATVLAMTFNEQHQLGQDLNGELGGVFFNVAEPLMIPNSADVDATISNASLLTTSDYRLQITAAAVAGPPDAPAEYQVERISDGQIFPDSPASVDGLAFALNDPPSEAFVVGDSFVIKPVVNGVSGISVAISDTAKIAAAAPAILTYASNLNIGTGQISQGVIDSVESDLLEKITITFDTTTTPTTFDVEGAVSGSLATGMEYTAGNNISYNGWTVQISGEPQNGDVFTIDADADVVGDSTNALLLGGLQTTDLLDGGSTTYQGAYAKLVNFIGNKTNELAVTSSAADVYYDQALVAQQSESGVNLDEEASNLLRYQQAYQAAAQLMQTSSKLFDLLLSLGG